MSNLDAPRGAQYVGTVSGGGNAAPAIREYTKDASGGLIFPGDFVHLETDGAVRAANAAEAIIGVVSYVKVDMDIAETEYPGYGPSASIVTVGVIIDPDALYAIQDSGTNAATAVGDNSEIVATDGSTVTGRSAHELLTTLAGATAQLRRVAVSDKVGNDISAANSEWIVMINEHALRTPAGV